MSSARNITPPTPDDPISELQKVNARVFDIAEGRLSGWRRALIAARRWRAPIWMPRNLLVAAAAVVFLLLLGFGVYAFRRPASPLAPGALLLNQNVKQNVPFDSAAITPSTPAPSLVTPPTTTPAARPAIPKPSAAKRAAKLRWHPRQDTSSTALNQQPDNQ